MLRQWTLPVIRPIFHRMLPALSTPIPGPRSLALAERLKAVECRNTTLLGPDWPMFWERAEGVNVWDADGNRFLDMTSAFGVAGLGHGATAAAARTQTETLVHAMGDVHPARLKVDLCEAISAITWERWTGEKAKTLLGNSGFEAVEAALKTAVLATGRSSIVSFEGAYHGLGYGALLAAGIPWFREPFDGQLAHIDHRLPFPRTGDGASITAFREALAGIDGKSIAAIIVEPIQGRGGMVVPHDEFLHELRDWCDANGALLVLDEIFTGFHRSGKLFACEWSGVVPDLICLGKALSGGFPISACTGSARVMDAWPETHGEALHTSTFLGNPLGCAMAIDALAKHSLPETAALVAETSRHLDEAISTLREIPGVHSLRGRGLMRGIELRHPDGRPAGDKVVGLVTALLKKGLILLPDAPEGHVIALSPPFGVSRGEIDFAVSAIADHLAG